MTWLGLARASGAALVTSIMAVASAYGQSLPVTFVGDERVASIEAQGWNEPRQKVTCGSSCAVDLVPGKYSLTVTTPDGNRSATVLSIRRPSRIAVAPPNRIWHGVGIGVTVTGGLAALVGFGAFYYGLPRALIDGYGCEINCERIGLRLMALGFTGMFAGSAVMGIGVMILSATARPTTRVTRPAPTGGSLGDRASLWLRPGIGARWTGLELGGRF